MHLLGEENAKSLTPLRFVSLVLLLFLLEFALFIGLLRLGVRRIIVLLEWWGWWSRSILSTSSGGIPADHSLHSFLYNKVYLNGSKVLIGDPCLLTPGIRESFKLVWSL